MKSKWVVMCILALLTCTLSGCNTKIGWPWDYWQSGIFAIIGFLVVYGVIFVGLVGLGASIASQDRDALISGVGLLLVAALLLQALPHTASGIQLVPLFPWYFDGWLAKIISSMCWLALVLGCLASFSPSKSDWKGAAIKFVVVLGLNVLLSFAGPPDVTTADAPQQPPSVLTSFRGKVAQCETLRKERSEALEKLLSDKEALVARIKGLGCRTKQELMAHRIGSTLATELEQLSRQIASLQSETEAVEAVLERAQSVQRSVERQVMLKGHGILSETEFAQLSQIDHELQEELRKIIAPVPGTEVQMDKLLDGVLAP